MPAQHNSAPGHDPINSPPQSHRCLPKRWRVDPAYSTVHGRLRKQRGKASAHACVDCSGPAAAWSYDGLDPDEKTGPRGLKYSTDLAHYQPRCHLCHVEFDGIAEKIRSVATIRAAKVGAA